MKVHIPKIIVLALALTIFATIVKIGTSGQTNSFRNEWNIVKNPIRVNIKVTETQAPNVLTEMWYGNFPSHKQVELNKINHISLLRVFDNANKEIRCQPSAWNDLGNINKVEIHPQKDGFKIVIEGGDGGAAYQAALYFKNNKLVKRKVSDVVGDGTDHDAFEYTNYN